MGFTELLLVSSGFIIFYWVFTKFSQIVQGFEGHQYGLDPVYVGFLAFFLVSSGFIGFHLIILDFYQILSRFTRFYWVLPVH